MTCHSYKRLKTHDFVQTVWRVQEPRNRLQDANALTRNRYDRQQENVTKREDYWATASAREITRRWLPELVEGLKEALRPTSNTRPVNREFLALIRPDEEAKSERKQGLDPETLALCILRGALQSIGKNESYSDTAALIGENIRMECLRAEIVGKDSKLPRRIEKRVKDIGGIKETPAESAQRSGTTWL